MKNVQKEINLITEKLQALKLEQQKTWWDSEERRKVERLEIEKYINLFRWEQNQG